MLLLKSNVLVFHHHFNLELFWPNSAICIGFCYKLYIAITAKEQQHLHFPAHFGCLQMFHQGQHFGFCCLYLCWMKKRFNNVSFSYEIYKWQVFGFYLTRIAHGKLFCQSLNSRIKWKIKRAEKQGKKNPSKQNKKTIKTKQPVPKLWLQL